VALNVFSCASIDGNCASPPLPNDDCGFYSRCLENTIPCGSTGYALGYGDKYCQRFNNSTRECVSTKGKAWITSTLACLQKSLVPMLSQKTLGCDELQKDAFDSHPICYTGDGNEALSICELPLSDWGCVVSTIDAKDALSQLGLQQEARVAAICIQQWTSRTTRSCQSDERCAYWMKVAGQGHVVVV